MHSWRSRVVRTSALGCPPTLPLARVPGLQLGNEIQKLIHRAPAAGSVIPHPPLHLSPLPRLRPRRYIKSVIHARSETYVRALYGPGQRRANGVSVLLRLHHHSQFPRVHFRSLLFRTQRKFRRLHGSGVMTFLAVMCPPSTIRHEKGLMYQ